MAMGLAETAVLWLIAPTRILVGVFVLDTGLIKKGGSHDSAE